ncbi:MAG: hypothetical protein JSV03_14925 [Planctomycetota bacterium]|nr:MAG: hypothetical protein JSV03_14925 [Planctomycetota bacterium]
MIKTRHIFLGLTAILTILTVQLQGAHLRGQVVHVGFPAGGLDPNTVGSDHYRLGHWTPILVELTNQDGDLFTGWIEVRQTDRDGDQIVAQRNVVVRETRRYYLYIPAGKFGDRNKFSVHVFNENGTLAPLYDNQNNKTKALIPSKIISEIPSETIVILDISEPPVNQLRELTGNEQLVRPLLVARISPKDLPDNAAGLDLADIIVWDAANPLDIDLHQQQAVIEWTRNGGTLLVGVSKNWEMVGKSKLGNILPAKLKGAESTQKVRELAKSLFGYTDTDFDPPELELPLPYCPVTQETLAPDAVVIVPAEPKSSDRLFVTSRPCGRGRVILAAAELGDLFKHGTTIQQFLHQILSIRIQRKSQEESYRGLNLLTDLFTSTIDNFIGFQVLAGAYLLFAFLFVSVYILAATAGNWTWLKRKNMIQHNWLAFTLVAILASGFSLVAVRSIRGYGYKVQELTIVDGKAGSFDASARCYFGLKTGAHTSLDLCVPADWSQPDESAGLAANLRPLPPIPSRSETSIYATGKQYQSAAAQGKLLTVPLRATLKQFEAQWRGQMNYRLNAALRRVSGDDPYLHQTSWIRNSLNIDLKDCYLLVPAPSIKGNDPTRSMQIYVYPIGDLANGEKLEIKTLHDQKTLEQQKGKIPNMSGLTDTGDSSAEDSKWEPPTLSVIHDKWLEKLGIRTDIRSRPKDDLIKILTNKPDSALLLLTTFDDVDQWQIKQKGQEIGRSQGQRLDRSSVLTKDTALFVGFSEDPGPARLCRRKPGTSTGSWKAIQPSESHIMYRIKIPIAK